jgi:hypothetical protein
MAMMPLLAFLLAALTSAQPTSTPEAALDAKAIYLKTVAAVNALSLPAYIEFTSQNQSNGTVAERLHIVVRVSDGYAFVETLADQNGRPTPVAPVKVVTNGTYPGTIYRVGDFPLADFGLRKGTPSRPGIFEDTSTPEPEASDALRSIAAVHVVDIAYALVDLGDDTIDGRAVYHLGMTPLRDPGHHVLRQMWVDKSTFLPLRYVAERFVDAQLFKFRYLVTVDTVLMSGHLVNVDADGHYDVHRAFFFHYAGEGRWSISDVSFPTTEPGWMFDPSAPRKAASPSP